MIASIFLYGFVSAFGWWTANYAVIDPYFPKAKQEQTCQQP